MSEAPIKTLRARELRRTQTIYEAKLWRLIRNRQLEGFKFRRQMPIGPYFADFACPAARLIVELDGNSHDGRIERDANRDAVLEEWGWLTLRFLNVSVRDNPDGVWDEIEKHIKARFGTSLAVFSS